PANTFSVISNFNISSAKRPSWITASSISITGTSITKSQKFGIEIEVVEGLQFDRGYISPYMVTDAERMEAVLDEPYILILNKKLGAIAELLPVLEKVMQAGKPLLLIAEDVEGEALATIVVNKIRGTFICVAVKAPGFGDRRKDLIDIEPGNTTEESYGLAIDVGTTTVVVYLVNLNNGKILTSASEYNKQIRAGEDVISRIVYSLKGAGLEVLQGLIVETINELIVEVCKRTSVNSEKIHSIVCAGNTIMTHFLHGVSPKYLREEPYVPVANIFSPVSSKD
ncbi:unnamed protein product, partial [marine sediment metagenome]